MRRQLWRVSRNNCHVVCWAINGDDAKQQARQWLDGNPAYYSIHPITAIGDRVHLAITLQT